MKKLVLLFAASAMALAFSSCKKCTVCVSIDPDTGNEINRASACGSESYVEGYEDGFGFAAADSGWVSTCVRTK